MSWGREWKANEIAQAVWMRAEGHSFLAIGRALDRDDSTVRKMLARRAGYTPRPIDRQQQTAAARRVSMATGWPRVPFNPEEREQLYLTALLHGLRAEGLAA